MYLSNSRPRPYSELENGANSEQSGSPFEIRNSNGDSLLEPKNGIWLQAIKETADKVGSYLL